MYIKYTAREKQITNPTGAQIQNKHKENIFPFYLIEFILMLFKQIAN